MKLTKNMKKLWKMMGKGKNGTKIGEQENENSHSRKKIQINNFHKTKSLWMWNIVAGNQRKIVDIKVTQEKSFFK